MNACPSREQLQQLLAEQLTEEMRVHIEDHVEACAACADVLARLSDQAETIDWQYLRSGRAVLLPDAEAAIARYLKGNPPEPTALGLEEAGGGEAIGFPGPPTDKGPLGQLENYHIRRVLGHGRFGVVYEACDELDRLVAIKVLKPELAASARERVRFEHEARKAAAVKHDHTVTIYRVGHTPGFPLPYLVMEYVDGEPLSDRLERQGVLEAKEAARIVQQVAHALAAAHARGLVHRDIKPSNILLEAGSGRAKLTDFGLARATEVGGVSTSQSGRIVGSPAYMSPEQTVAPAKIDGRSDIYSLGVVLYELLTGERPFRGAAHLLLQQVVHDEPRPLRKLNDRIPRDLETICLKAMAKAQARRYATGRELADDLRRFLNNEPIHARPVGQVERLWRWCRRNPGLAGALGAAALFLLIGSLVSSLLGIQALAEAQRADREAGVARENEKLAKENEKLAKGNEKLAREAKLLSDRRYYASEMKLASLDAKAGQMGLVQQRLREHEPRGASDPDLREFEWYYLQRLCQLDLRTPKGHTDAVHGVAYSPDGRHLASASDDQTVKVWDTASGQELLTLRGHTKPVWGVAYSPDGRRLASASADRTVKLWDAATGQDLLTLKGHTKEVESVAFSPDGYHLASTSRDGTVKVWDTASAQNLLTLKGHTTFVCGVAYSPDGRHLASASDDQTVKVWDAASGQNLLTLKGHTRWVRGVAYSPDGRRLASASADGTVKVWNAASGQNLLTLTGHRSLVGGVAYSPDGRRLASASRDGTVKVWDAGSGQDLLTLTGHTGLVWGVAFSADGRRLASAGEDQTVKVWNAGSGQDLLTLKRHRKPVEGVAFSPGRAECVAFSPDGRRLASAGEDQTVKVWDAASGQDLLTLKGHTKGVIEVAFSPDGRRLASASDDWTVKVWDTASGQNLLTLTGHTTVVGCVVYSPDGRHLASASRDQTVRIWDAATGRECLTLKGHTDRVHKVAYSPDSRRLASASSDGTVKVWDATTGQNLLTFKGHTKAVGGVAFSPDGRRLASASADQTVKVWDAATGREILTLKGHTKPVQEVAYSPDGRRLASGSHDQTVKVWDAVTGQDLLTLTGHTGLVDGVAFSPDGRRLASASEDRTVRLWDATALTP